MECRIVSQWEIQVIACKWGKCERGVDLQTSVLLLRLVTSVERVRS